MDPVAAHSRHLLQQLHEQRIQGLLCDCMLVVKGVCFKAHKNVLAAFSQYFRGLFQNSSGQKGDVFHLDIKNVSGIGQILDFMYTSHLDLNQDNIQVVLDIAQCLQVPNVLSLCHAFLKSTAVEQPPGTACASTFPLQSALTAGPSGAGNENYPPPLLPESPAEVQQGKALDEPHSPAPPAAGLHHPAGEASKQAPDPLEGGCPELPSRTGYYYKLRSFYSKQYYKHAAGPGHERASEQACLFSASPSPDHSAAAHSQCGLGSHLLAPTPSEAAPEPEPPAKQMRLKKAVHLKKLNFLKSQRSAEPAPAATPGDDVTGRLDAVPADARDAAGSRGAGEGGSAEHLEHMSDAEGPGDAAVPGGPPPALQSQRQCACELCGKPFKHPSNLALHRRSHTGRQLADSLTSALRRETVHLRGLRKEVCSLW
uniref:Zinc finger and BTB domain containing 49 n=1 Tax=Suricata suricatta TaxID=37032 RepID=A0A673SKL9_SURSU